MTKLQQPVIYLIIIIISCWLLLSMLTKSSFFFDNNEIIYVPEAKEYIIGATIEQYNCQGQLIKQIMIKNWSFLTSQGLSSFKEPRFKILNNNYDTYWYLSAESGEAQHLHIGSPIEKIFLTGNVKIYKSEQDTNSLPFLMETTELDYYPASKYLETDKFVTLYKPGLKITGQGLEAYLDSQQLSLLKDVKTFYEYESLNFNNNKHIF